MTNEATTPSGPRPVPGSRRLHVGVTPWAPSGSEDAADLIRQARLAESLGFDSFFLPESHLHAGARPAPLIALAAIAGATERIRLGTTSLLLPLRQPLLLAEEIATLDRLSGGRCIIGLGRGFRRATFDVFGIDPRTKRERFEEVLATMLRAWGVEPGWVGAPGAPEEGVPLVEPQPLQRPHPPLWVAAFGPKAIAQAARLGLPYFASPMESLAAVEKNLRIHHDLRSSEGAVPVMRTVLVSSDPATCADAARALRAEREALARSRPQRVTAAGTTETYAVVGDRKTATAGILGIIERLAPTHLIVRSPAALNRISAERSLELLAAIRSELDALTVRPDFDAGR